MLKKAHKARTCWYRLLSDLSIPDLKTYIEEKMEWTETIAASVSQNFTDDIPCEKSEELSPWLAHNLKYSNRAES